MDLGSAIAISGWDLTPKNRQDLPLHNWRNAAVTPGREKSVPAKKAVTVVIARMDPGNAVATLWATQLDTRHVSTFPVCMWINMGTQTN